MSIAWLKGLLLSMPGRLAGAIVGTALTVTLLGTLGAFVASSAATMTIQAMARVPVDWQVQLTPGADARAVVAAIGRATPYTALQSVGYADVASLSLAAGGSTQVTGAGKVVGIDRRYARAFPGEIRALVGAPDGVLLAQQTAANLHAKIGDSITIGRMGVPAVRVRVDGVVDLPAADSLFQAVGLPPGAAPQAPPDNVAIVPQRLWQKLFSVQARLRPDSVHRQLHVRIGHTLPTDPGEAYVAVERMVKNLEARVAGSAIVGDNLGAALLSARADALYARVLFLFLGLPGAALAVMLTVVLAASGSGRRRREQALLRVRGASTVDILQLAGLEAAVAAVGGVILGSVVSVSVLNVLGIAASGGALRWLIGAAGAGLAVAAGAVLAPAWLESRHLTVSAARAAIGRERTPLWQRLYLDFILLLLAGLAFWQTARGGYQVVLAPEGIAQSAVRYDAFLGPFLLWIATALLTIRLWSYLLGPGRAAVAAMLGGLAGRLRGVVAASLSRQRSMVTRGIVFVALAFAFAVSTAIFNTTYNAQTRVDAQLTNGADVAVTGPPGSSPAAQLEALRRVPGVVAASSLQHRYAYVGNDLQDLYGVDASGIARATAMSNAFFGNGNARETLAELRRYPDGILASEEMVRDFQLNPGDRLNLRLQFARDHRYHVVPFRLIGVVREFPTAPKDSFLVANAAYVAQKTASGAAEIVLVRAAGDPRRLAERIRPLFASLPGVRISDIVSAQRTVTSTLTAVDLRGLTSLELVFAVLFAAAAGGLVLALDLAERRRTFAILAALGARERQLGAFVWSESLIVLFGGAIAGVALGAALALMLVKVLTGVFDPPPESLAIPWAYLGVVAAVALVANAATVYGVLAAARASPVTALREM